MDLYELGKQTLAQGRNITQALREHLKTSRNSPEVIEVAYDLQAGTYVQFAEENLAYVHAYAAQLARLLDEHLQPGDVILDGGTGELTNLSHMAAALTVLPAKIYACDISERRLEVGRLYADKHMPPIELETFKAELSSIPLPDASVDVVTTNHAVEPNGGREREILRELLRVARRKLVLFEPCFELGGKEARARMTEHGYIRGMADHASALGAIVESVVPLEIVHNPLNPTACFVIGIDPKMRP